MGCKPLTQDVDRVLKAIHTYYIDASDETWRIWGNLGCLLSNDLYQYHARDIVTVRPLQELPTIFVVVTDSEGNHETFSTLEEARTRVEQIDSPLCQNGEAQRLIRSATAAIEGIEKLHGDRKIDLLETIRSLNEINCILEDAIETARSDMSAQGLDDDE